MQMKKFSIMTLLVGALMLMGCKGAGEQVPVALSWESVAVDGGYDNIFTIKNVSGKALQEGWAIYYSQFPREVKGNG